jgi:hypothetical protein
VVLEGRRHRAALSELRIANCESGCSEWKEMR